MRSIQGIEADIARLKGELEDVKVFNAKAKSAIHILENLGWTHSASSSWMGPSDSCGPTPYVAKSPEVNDIVRVRGHITYYVVRSVIDTKTLLVSKVRRVFSDGCLAEQVTIRMATHSVVVMDHTKLIDKVNVRPSYNNVYGPQ